MSSLTMEHKNLTHLQRVFIHLPVWGEHCVFTKTLPNFTILRGLVMGQKRTQDLHGSGVSSQVDDSIFSPF